MGFFNKIFPVAENKIVFYPNTGANKGANSTEGRTVKVPLTVIEDDAPSSVASSQQENLVANESEQYILSSAEFRKQKDELLESLDNKSIMVIPIDQERWEILAECRKILELLRRNKTEIIAKSSSQKDICRAIVDKIIQKNTIGNELKSQLNLLLEQVLSDIGNEVVLENNEEKIENSELENKLPDIQNDDEKELEKDAENRLTEIAPLKAAENKSEKKKDTRGENFLERVFDLIERTKNARIEKIKNNEKGVGLIIFDKISTKDLSEEEIEKILLQVRRANGEIMKVKKEIARKEVLSAKPVKKNDITENVIEVEEKNREMANEFRAAAELVKKSTFSREEFEKEYGIELPEKAPLEFDMQRELLGTAEILEEHHEDAFPQEKGEEFRLKVDLLSGTVKNINNPQHSMEMVVIEGGTYFLSKDLQKVDSSSETTIENDKEKEVLDITLELVRNFRNELNVALAKDESWKKRRVQYQESFLEGEVVAFLDELLDQEDIVSNDKRENFIQKVLENIKK